MSAGLASRFLKKNHKREPGRETGKYLSDYKQDGNAAIGGIGNLACGGPSTVSEIQT